MTHQTSTLDEFIQVLHDGESFYAEAAEKVKAPVYRDLFQRMARIKSSVATELERAARTNSELLGRCGTLGRWAQAYADKPVGVGKVAEKIYLTLLEETEDRILDDFRSHLQDKDAVVRDIFWRSLPEVQKANDDMLYLKTRLTA